MDHCMSIIDKTVEKKRLVDFIISLVEIEISLAGVQVCILQQ